MFLFLSRSITVDCLIVMSNIKSCCWLGPQANIICLEMSRVVFCYSIKDCLFDGIIALCPVVLGDESVFISI